MKYLIMLIVGISPCYGQFFNGTIYDVNSGDVQVFNGQIFEPTMTRHEEIMESFRLLREAREAREQLQMQREQLRLLRQIANQ